MNIQAEKIELIRLITEVSNEKILKKVREVLSSVKKEDETEKIMSNPAMVKRLEDSRKQFAVGEGVKISLDDIWK